MELFDYNPECVLAIFAHPDDAEVACGGTLARYVSRSANVHIVTIAKGNKGAGEQSVRENESQFAQQALGVHTMRSLGYSDGEFDNDLELRKELTQTIRLIKPDLIICPDPTAVFFSNTYINHRDHRVTGWATLDVVSSAVSNPKYFPESAATNVNHILCAGTQEPNCVIDISETIDKKISSVLYYKSQITDQNDSVEASIKMTAQQFARHTNCIYAEGFRHIELLRQELAD